MTDGRLTRRGFLTKAIVGGTVALGAVGAGVANRTGRLPVEATVVGQSDEMKIQRVSTLEVRVRNHGNHPISPQFSTVREGLQTRFYWEIASKRRLSPGDERTLRLQAGNPAMAVPYGERFVLLIEGSNATQGRTISDTSQSPPQLLPVRNSAFDEWLTAVSQSTASPFRWRQVSETRLADEITVTETDDGVALRAARRRSSGPWTMSGLQQRAPALSTVSVTARPGTLTKPSRIRSGSVCGLEFIDRNHRVWLVFTDTDEQSSEYIGGDLDYHVEYLPATQGAVTDATVDLGRIYDERGWTRPPTIRHRVDGTAYDASRLILHPFAAVYTDGERAAVEFHKVDGSR